MQLVSSPPEYANKTFSFSISAVIATNVKPRLSGMCKLPQTYHSIWEEFIKGYRLVIYDETKFYALQSFYVNEDLLIKLTNPIGISSTFKEMIC